MKSFYTTYPLRKILEIKFDADKTLSERIRISALKIWASHQYSHDISLYITTGLPKDWSVHEEFDEKKQVQSMFGDKYNAILGY